MFSKIRISKLLPSVKILSSPTTTIAEDLLLRKVSYEKQALIQRTVHKNSVLDYTNTWNCILGRGCFIDGKSLPRTLLSSFNKFRVITNESGSQALLRAFSSSALNSRYKNQESNFKGVKTVESQNDLSIDEFQRVCSHQSVFGLLTSVIKFFLHIIAAILKVLFHLIKMLAGEKGEKLLGDASTRAKQLENNRTLNKANADIRKNYEKTKAVVEEKAPIMKQKIEDEIPNMRRSLETFERRLDDELTQAKTPKEKRQKFMEILTDLIKSNKVYQFVATFILVYILWKIFKCIFF